jgi:hypothetical protein
VKTPRRCLGPRGREDKKGALAELETSLGSCFRNEVVMRLEPKECRLQALTCERLAQRSTSPIVKGAYADLAKKWLKVADELQRPSLLLMGKKKKPRTP